MTLLDTLPVPWKSYIIQETRFESKRLLVTLSTFIV